MSLSPNEAAAAVLKRHTSLPLQECTAFAPVNIALCKYWGKRDSSLNLPVNDSISVSMAHKGTHTTVAPATGEHDEVYFNGELCHTDSSFFRRVIRHTDLFRCVFGRVAMCVRTRNNIPPDAGLASSASGFAALTRALAGAYGLALAPDELSVLARLGSGSACRSVYKGFVRWHRGNHPDGRDSYALPLKYDWPDLCVGIVTVDAGRKPVSSRAGMEHTVNSSPFYAAWKDRALQDLTALEQSIAVRDFPAFGKVSEYNAMAMHASMLASRPPLFYWTEQTIRIVHKVWQCRADGLDVYCTLDAGPNVKLLFESKGSNDIRRIFDDVEIISPFNS